MLYLSDIAREKQMAQMTEFDEEMHWDLGHDWSGEFAALYPRSAECGFLNVDKTLTRIEM